MRSDGTCLSLTGWLISLSNQLAPSQGKPCNPHSTVQGGSYYALCVDEEITVHPLIQHKPSEHLLCTSPISELNKG